MLKLQHFILFGPLTVFAPPCRSRDPFSWEEWSSSCQQPSEWSNYPFHQGPQRSVNYHHPVCERTGQLTESDQKSEALAELSMGAE